MDNQETSEPQPNSQEIIQTPKSDPMKEFDRLAQEQERLGQELDKQMVEVILDWKTWRRDISKWTENERDIEYKIQTIGNDGNQRTFGVNDDYGVGTDIVEYGSNGEGLGFVSLYNWAGMNLGDKLSIDKPIKSAALIAYVSKDDLEKGIEPDSQFRGFYKSWGSNLPPGGLKWLATTAYGYVLAPKGLPVRRDRFVKPGAENLPSPMDIAKDTLDLIKSGQITHKRVGSEREWTPVNSADLQPNPNT